MQILKDMVKSKFKFWFKAALISAFVYITGCAETPVREINKTEMDDFLTQFSTLNISDFDPFMVSDVTMIDFCVDKLYTDDFKAFQNTDGEPEWYIADSIVDKAAVKYFGKNISNHQSTEYYAYKNGKYEVFPSDGAGFTFCQIDSILGQVADTAVLLVDVYDAPSTFNGDLHSKPETWVDFPEDEQPVFLKKVIATVVKSDDKCYLAGWRIYTDF